MDPALEAVRMAEQIALETPLAVVNSLRKTVKKR